MVSGTWKAREVIALVRALARRHEPRLKVQVLTGRSGRQRGKGSHVIYVLVDGKAEIGRFALTSHGDVSRLVLRNVEGALAHLFGEGWISR
jgi:hypothetical protein